MTQTATETPPAPIAVRERGYANSGDTTGWLGDLLAEHIPELQWPVNLGVYRRMLTDAQVKSVMRAVISPILGTRWSVDKNGSSDEITEFVASNLGLPIHGTDPEDAPSVGQRGRDRFSWDEHMRWALNMLPFGHMFFEQVYRFDDAGRARLRKLGPRWPKSISKITVARDGGLVSIQQRATSGSPGVLRLGSLSPEQPLPVNRLVAYVFEREDDWRGQSILRPAYKNWLLKEHELKTWSISDERNGVGLMLYEGAQGEKSLAEGKKIATEMRGGSTSGAAIAHGAKLGAHGVTGELPDHDKFVRYQDEQIARTALGHMLNLGSQGGGQVGSYALGSVFQNTFHLGVTSVAKDLRNTADAHVIEDLVALNFGLDVAAPRLHFDPIGTSQDDSDQENPLDLLRRAAGLEDDDQLAAFIRTNVPATQEIA